MPRETGPGIVPSADDGPATTLRYQQDYKFIPGKNIDVVVLVAHLKEHIDASATVTPTKDFGVCNSIHL